MAALTRDESLARRAMPDVHHYNVDLDLTRGDEQFGSWVTIRFAFAEQVTRS